ncbi:hypothetical protein EV122DRAFT_271188, partial [Schizophyllum commune]
VENTAPDSVSDSQPPGVALLPITGTSANPELYPLPPLWRSLFSAPAGAQNPSHASLQLPLIQRSKIAGHPARRSRTRDYRDMMSSGESRIGRGDGWLMRSLRDQCSGRRGRRMGLPPLASQWLLPWVHPRQTNQRAAPPIGHARNVVEFSQGPALSSPT